MATMSNLNPPQEPARQRCVSKPLIPDRDFLRHVLGSGGDALRQCVQCATCSAVCGLAAEQSPLPRKEMLWAQWGIRDRLMSDVDLWLCHECHDCTERCPRGARPGDVMAALRRECVVYYSVPRFLGRSASRPAHLLWFILCSTAVLVVGAVICDRMQVTSNGFANSGQRIVIPFCAELPHELLIPLFVSILLLDCLVLGAGLARFWRALRISQCSASAETRVAGGARSVCNALERVILHRDFARCTDQAPRRISHTLVVWSMLGFGLVDLWVVTARYNPLRTGLVYPLGFFDPWKLLANLAGVALVTGSLLMSSDRLKRRTKAEARARPTGTYSDWLLLILLLAIALTGFITEAMHIARCDTGRIWAYSMHLVIVLSFFVLLPYSKLAHVGFRTVALVFAERYGQRQRMPPLSSDPKGAQHD